MTDQELRRLCRIAGLDASEVRDEPGIGLTISPAGIRKLAALAPDRAEARRFVEWSRQVELLVNARAAERPS